jgi:uncharacterized protein
LKERNPNRWSSDYPDLIQEAIGCATRPDSRDHGVHHWQLVAWTGAELLREVPGADPDLVFCFALFHDSMRFNEHADPEHGLRGGELAVELLKESPNLGQTRLDTLADACTRHTSGDTSSDPSVAVCWDSDRLNLWRVGYRPKPSYLSTGAAKLPQRIEWARRLQEEQYSWEQVCEAYSQLTAS